MSDPYLRLVSADTDLPASSKHMPDRSRAAPRCLWLAKTLPYPMIYGDRVYSANLAKALAAAGADICFVGLDEGAAPPPTTNIKWVSVAGGQRDQFAALWSSLPLVAARHQTSAYIRKLTELLASPQRWDVVVVDNYAMGWVLDQVMKSCPTPPILIFVAHNFEEGLSRGLWEKSASVLYRKVFLFLNYMKIRALERRMVASSNLTTTITASDAALFHERSASVRTLSLEPGYSGTAAIARKVSASIPRRILIFSSFVWSAKQESLRIFLDEADPAFAASNIEIEIVGKVPEAFATEITSRYKAVRLAGFVEDPTPHFRQARLAAIAEPIGGGFKMKILDYVFNGVPVLALGECLSGLPDAVCRHMFVCPDVPALVRRAIALIDDVETLDHAQAQAFEAARTLFSWSDRGEALFGQIQELLRQNPASPFRGNLKCVS